METTIKGNETYYDLEVRFGEIGAIIQSKDDNKHPAIGFSKQQALQLAAALTERYGGGEWIDAKVEPQKSGAYHVKGNGWIYGFYYARHNKWFDIGEKYEISITHYQPIIKPAP